MNALACVRQNIDRLLLCPCDPHPTLQHHITLLPELVVIWVAYEANRYALSKNVHKRYSFNSIFGCSVEYNPGVRNLAEVISGPKRREFASKRSLVRNCSKRGVRLA